LDWKTWVPLYVGLVREHGRERSRIHLVHRSLRLNALLNAKRVKFIKRVLEHAALSSRWERRAQARDHAIRNKVAIVQTIVIKNVMIPRHGSQLSLPCSLNMRMLLRESVVPGRLGMRAALGEALSLCGIL
jgi:hypothetical protein